ncbi:uncharacterized protein RAG0_07595 [Rhynchosporium agropyri]|uniref:DUF7732 domain-containing protein n=1 Tax=Rhynchosporium agropyri TaxID=914238 RepID=A0A1E1KM90_9HELO|nr:uncharacterized protein RAG0_07595 [Rhynchosporium agropyri]
MRFLETVAVCLLATNTPVLAHPQSVAEIAAERREAVREVDELFAPVSDLYKRKGGGGGGGKGGGGGSSGGSSGKGGSSSSSGSGGTSGYVPSFTHREGVRSNGIAQRVAEVGSSTLTSESSPERDYAVGEHDLTKDNFKPAAGEVKDASLRPRRFVRTALSARIVPAIIARPSVPRMVPRFLKLPPDKKDNANKPSASGSGGRGSGSSNVGGSTRTGSGVTPRFGGKYGGGASTPYKAGGVSPRGIAPVFLGVAALSILPGLWLYGAYGYGYHNPYSFRNRTARRNGTNTTDTPTRDYVQLITRLVSRQEDAGVSETKPVTCLCAEYAVCGCDDDGNYTFLDSIIGDGDYFKLNTSLVNVANDANGTSTIYLNGTLPNGTTAAGGTEEADGSSANANGPTNAALRTLVEASGYWVMVAAVGLTCFAI